MSQNLTAATATEPSPVSPPTPSPAPAPDKAAMRFILMVVLIDMLAVGIIVPVLPAMVGQFTQDASDQARWYGIVAISYALAQFIAAPILGALSDRYGRRPVLLLGFTGLALNFFATAMATAAWMLVASRIVGGAMQANAAVAQAYVADITPPQERARRFGLLGAMFGIGFILGPVLGGLLGGIDLRLPFFAAGGLALINLVYGYFVLPESLSPEQRRSAPWWQANPLSSFRQLAALRGVGVVVAVLAFAGLAQFSLYTSWVLWGTHRFGWGPTESGWSLFAVGLVSAIVQGGLLGRLLKRFGAPKLAILGLASSTTAFTLWGFATENWMVYAVIFVNILGAAIASSLQGMVSAAASEKVQGQTMGAVSSLSSLTAVFAPVLVTPLLVIMTAHPRTDWQSGLPLFFCAALQGTALLLAIWHARRTPPPAAAIVPPAAH
jgi:MFS transporter, DHA1 family, tetracycline resistance protein